MGRAAVQRKDFAKDAGRILCAIKVVHVPQPFRDSGLAITRVIRSKVTPLAGYPEVIPTNADAVEGPYAFVYIVLNKAIPRTMRYGEACEFVAGSTTVSLKAFRANPLPGTRMATIDCALD